MCDHTGYRWQKTDFPYQPANQNTLKEFDGRPQVAYNCLKVSHKRLQLSYKRKATYNGLQVTKRSTSNLQWIESILQVSTSALQLYNIAFKCPTSDYAVLQLITTAYNRHTVV